MSEKPRVRLSIASRVENVNVAVTLSDAAFARAGVDEDGLHRLGLAVSEAVANAVVHGNGGDANGRVDVELGVTDDTAVVQVADRGIGFDVAAVPDPLAPANLLRPGGRGLLLMHRLMDHVEIRPRARGGTTVTLQMHVGTKEGARP